LEVPGRELLSGGGKHVGFAKWGEEEFGLFTERLNLRPERRNVAILLGSQENAEHARDTRPRLDGKFSALLLVDYDHVGV
jgi:hypothetical protein